MTLLVDRFGAVASAICALHCGVMALAPAVLPLVGLGFLHDERFEWLFLAAAVVFAAGAAWVGHRTHGATSISIGFLVGAVALVAARLAEVVGIEGGLALALFGGAALVTTHILNHRRCRDCVEAAA